MESRRVYQFDDVTVDLETMRLSRGGNDIPLEPKSFFLLEFLILNRHRVVSKDELLSVIWKDVIVTDNALSRAITQIRKALNDDSRKPRFIETVPTVGYRFTGTIQPPPIPTRDPAAPPLTTPAGSVQSHTRPYRTAALIALFCLVLAGGGIWLARSQRPRPIHAMAVLPLENLSGDAREDYFAEGTTDELITQLALIPNLRIATLNSDRPNAESQKPLRQIAEDLHVDAIVEGSVVRSNDLVRINARLVDIRNDEHLWAQSFEDNADNVLALEDEVARQIASHARLTITGNSVQPPSDNRKINPAAHDAYLRGLYHFDRRDPIKSAEAFQQAVDLDPTYAEAYGGLATSLLHKGFFENTNQDEVAAKVTALAQKAIGLDPNVGTAYFALGELEITTLRDWPAAERNLQKGLKLNPSYAPGEMVYAVYLDCVNRPADAVDHMRHAVEIAPLSFYMARHLGSTLYLNRRYDEAITQLLRAREMQPDAHVIVDNWLSWAYLKKGMHDDAVKYDLSALTGRAPQPSLERLQSIYQQHGWRAYWQARLDFLQQSPHPVCGLYHAGVIYTILGDRDKAFSDLSLATDQKCFWMTEIAVDPLLDDLRGDPRFNDLLRKINRPPQ